MNMCPLSILKRYISKLLIFIVGYYIQFTRRLNIPIYYSLKNGGKIKLIPDGQILTPIILNRFEEIEVEIYQRVLKPRMVVVDAGANIGLYSLIASSIVGNEGIVFAFEPSEDTFKKLRANISLNNCKNILPYQVGLGDLSKETLILRQDVGTGDAERYVFPGNNEPIVKLINVNNLEDSEEIVIETLDNILNYAGIQSIDFLKIDTEGFEYYILQGALSLIRSNKNIIILMECTALGTARASTSQRAVFSLLYELDFHIFYFSKETMEWLDDENGLYSAGDIWALRNIDMLPTMN